MRVLVTGGAGMVGSHAADYWASRGHHVVVLDNLMRSKLFGSSRESVEHNWRYLEQRGGIELLRGDVRHPEDLARALGDGVDVVLHTAAQPSVDFSVQNPSEDFSINVLGTLQVLEAVRRRCPKAVVLFCSTNKVYGAGVERYVLTELAQRYVFRDQTRGVPEDLSIDGTGHTPYGVSKLAAELYVQECSHSYGMRTGVFRMSCIYGTRQFGFADQGWLAHCTIATLLGRPITLHGDGKQVRDVLYVTDLIEAFDRFVSSGLPRGVFNIGGGPGHTVSLHELLELLAVKTGKRSPLKQAPWRPHDQKVYISDLSHIRQSLGWEPRTRLPDGLDQLIQWVGAHLANF